MTIRTDRRRIEARENPSAALDARDAARQYLDARLRLARALFHVERSGAHVLASCSSIVQYAVRLGVPAAEARPLTDLGRTLESPASLVRPAAPYADDHGAIGPDGPPEPEGPSIEERVRAGDIAVANASLVGRLAAHPELVRPGEDWISAAESLPTPELRRRVHERFEEVAQGAAPLVSLHLHVTARARDEFQRARTIASRAADLRLTEGQAFTRIVRYYLDACAPDRRVSGPASAPRRDASGLPGARHVPADVRREVLRRSGDRCEVPGCALETFLEFAHVRARADGGTPEARNLLRLCHVHHTLFDADRLLLAGWRDGRPVFREPSGVELTWGLTEPAGPVERAGDARDAIPQRGASGTQVCERPPPWGRSRTPGTVGATRLGRIHGGPMRRTATGG